MGHPKRNTKQMSLSLDNGSVSDSQALVFMGNLDIFWGDNRSRVFDNVYLMGVFKKSNIFKAVKEVMLI